MTNLEIHIETSVHCSECRSILEFFLNGSAIKLQHDLYGIRGFETDAVKFFVSKGWRERSDKTWLCSGCHAQNEIIDDADSLSALKPWNNRMAA